jgi:hypothetical protein
MIYNFNNAPGSDVYDVESSERIDHVFMVNTETGAVVVAKQPVRMNHKGKIDRETIKFDLIHPIFGGGDAPCLFHCYGHRAA